MRGTSLDARVSTGAATAVEVGRRWETEGRSESSPSPPIRSDPRSSSRASPRSLPRIIYAYGMERGVGLIRSQDGGRTWTSQGFFLGERDAVEALAIDAEDAGIVYLATFNGDLYRSADG